VEKEITFLNASGFEIELIAYDAPENRNVHDQMSGHDVGVAHLCVEVEDVWAIYEALSNEEEFVSESQSVSNRAQISYVRDLDGNYVELMEPP